MNSNRTFVIHCARKREYNPAIYVYIGRPTIWGNPFLIGRDGTRAEVIQKYRDRLKTRPDLVAQIREQLQGKILGCYCAPWMCHGDILARIANDEEW